MRTTNTILDEIVARTQTALADRRAELPLEKILSRLERATHQRRNLGSALKNSSHIALIAEIKKASPSAGTIKTEFNHIEIAKAYQAAGVDAVSVLTEEKYFQGNPSFVTDVMKVTSVPILRKDFIIDPYQIYESKLLGADAILLIAGLLSATETKRFLHIAHSLELDCLVEAHNESELAQAIDCGAQIIGINNRDLKTFKVDLATFLQLAPMIPKDRVIVCESGINGSEDVEKAAKFGADAVLVGTSIMKSDAVIEKISELKVHRTPVTQIKICGITSVDDGLAAARFGADILGLNFFPGSPRYVSSESARGITAAVKSRFPGVKTAGVFVNPTLQHALEIVEQTGIDMCQLHGNLAPSLASALHESGERETILAVPVKDRVPSADISASAADYMLFDRFSESQHGGTGKTIPLDILRDCLSAAGARRVFVAGGVGEENIADIIALNPYGVDINSKVETRPGVKDHDKMKRIIARIREEHR